MINRTYWNSNKIDKMNFYCLKIELNAIALLIKACARDRKRRRGRRKGNVCKWMHRPYLWKWMRYVLIVKCALCSAEGHVILVAFLIWIFNGALNARDCLSLSLLFTTSTLWTIQFMGFLAHQVHILHKNIYKCMHACMLVIAKCI